MPDDLDLDDHDEPQIRGLRSSRDGRRAPRGFLHDDDGGGRHRKSVSRRDDGGDERRRANRREAPANGAPPVGAPGFQRDSNRPLPYAPGGARIAERPRGPYNDRPAHGDSRPGGPPPYGGRLPDSRGPGFRTDRPMNTPYRPGPASGRPDGQDRREGRPMPPRVSGAEARPSIPQQNRYPQQETRRAYGDRPPLNTRPGYQQTSAGAGVRRPDATPHRPVVQRDDPNRPRTNKTEEDSRP